MAAVMTTPFSKAWLAVNIVLSHDCSDCPGLESYPSASSQEGSGDPGQDQSVQCECSMCIVCCSSGVSSI